jgi:hypothetical protein
MGETDGVLGSMTMHPMKYLSCELVCSQFMVLGWVS